MTAPHDIAGHRRRTRIVATLGPATDPPEVLEAVLRAVPGERNTVKANRQFDASEKPRSLQEITPLDPGRRGSIRRVEIAGGRKTIALTLDICEIRGEVSGYDGDIFDYLRSESVKTTLFTGGKWMRSHLSRAQQLMTDPLFEIASHGFAHLVDRQAWRTAQQPAG